MQLAQAEATNYRVSYRQPVIIDERRITAQLTKCDGDWLEFELMECKTTNAELWWKRGKDELTCRGPHSLPGLTRPYVLPCFVFEVRGCNWSRIRLRVAWSAALRLSRQAPNIRLTASAPLSLALIPADVIVSR